MDIDLDNLPDDTARLRGMVREVVTTTSGQIADLLAENDKLRLLIQRLSRHQLGSRSEQLSPDQLQIELGTADPAGAGQQAEADTAMPANSTRSASREMSCHNGSYSASIRTGHCNRKGNDHGLFDCR